MSNFEHNLDETQPYTAPDGNFDQPKKRGWFGGCMIGCLIVGGISLVICAGVSFYLYKQGPKLMVQGAREVTKALLDESGLPAEEQVAILAQYDRIGDAYLAGDLPLQDLGLLMQDLVESPLMSVLILSGIDANYLGKSGLSEEEKAEARETIQRIVAGVMSDSIEQSELEPLMRHVRKFPDSTDPGQKQQVKASFTDDELRALFADAKELCDAKEIPAGESDVKISEKLREIIDKRLP